MHHHHISELESHYSTARDPTSAEVVLEGFHAIKHALRFGVVPHSVVSWDLNAIELLAAELAPDVSEALTRSVTEISKDHLARLAPRAPNSPMLGIGPRRRADLPTMFAPKPRQHIVLLEDPRHTGNVGAVIRVAAAAEAAGVVTVGEMDPWSAPVLRGAAGLHYAISVGSVAHLDEIPRQPRPLVALDPDGKTLRPDEIAPHAVLMFGTERHGLSQASRDRATATFSLPMRPGVSSLNLATAVSAALFILRSSQQQT